MKKVAIVHYLPIEYYPPATNLIDYFSTNLSNSHKIFVYSSTNVKRRKSYQQVNVCLTRFPFPKEGNPSFIRLFKYLVFNIGTLIDLLWKNPNAILYYESFSAWPVYWFMRLRGRNCQLFIHYHEYFTPEWYENGMKTVKNYYEKEKKFLWRRADWISHTNKERIAFFKQDYPFIDSSKLKVTPNYPPSSWCTHGKVYSEVSVIKSVYVGSLSLSSTYLKEYCEWVIAQKGAIDFTIYSFNLHQDTIEYLNNLNCPYIEFKNEGVEYHELPNVLKDYHVGVILYKGVTKNFQFNAPNKLFEYLACGLDVWFPLEMLGIKSYQIDGSLPKVLEMDFKKLNGYDPGKLFERNMLTELNQRYFCEDVYKEIVEGLNE